MTGAVIKVLVIALSSTLTALIIKRGSPEISAVLALAACGAIVYITYETLVPVVEFIRRTKSLSQLSAAAFAPVMKCLGIALISKLGSDLCRDGGQGAIAGAVELMGAVAALYCALPLMSGLLDTMEKLL